METMAHLLYFDDKSWLNIVSFQFKLWIWMNLAESILIIDPL